MSTTAAAGESTPRPRVATRPELLKEIQKKWRDSFFRSAEPGVFSHGKCAVAIHEYQGRGGRWRYLTDEEIAEKMERLQNRSGA